MELPSGQLMDNGSALAVTSGRFPGRASAHAPSRTCTAVAPSLPATSVVFFSCAKKNALADAAESLLACSQAYDKIRPQGISTRLR